MIEVLPSTALQRQFRKIFVVVILLNDENAFGRQCGNNPVGNSRLSGTCAATYSDDQSLCQESTSKSFVRICRRADFAKVANAQVQSAKSLDHQYGTTNQAKRPEPLTSIWHLQLHLPE